MSEFWDIYDENRNKTGRTAQRGVYQFKDGEYHIVVTAIILNMNDYEKNIIRKPLKKLALSIIRR